MEGTASQTQDIKNLQELSFIEAKDAVKSKKTVTLVWTNASKLVIKTLKASNIGEFHQHNISGAGAQPYYYI